MKTKLQLVFTAILITFSMKAQVPNYVPTNSLVAWYSFTGNANDLSGNSNSLTAINGASLTSDRFGTTNSAYGLDGIDDWLETSSNFYNPSISHSLAFWWKTADSNKTNQTFFNTNPHTTENFAFHYSSVNPTPPYDLRFGLGDGVVGSWSIINPDLGQIVIPPNFNKWHHSVLVRSSTNWIFYHDGKAVYTYTSNLNTVPTNATLRFGAENNIPSGGAQYKGFIDDIGIWNRALSACEVLELYNIGISPVSAVTFSSLICIGQTATLSASGANSYTWNPGAIVGGTVTITPSVTTTYTVIGTSSLTSCNNSTIVVQNVSPCTGINENIILSDLEIKIFPNPNSGEFVISTEQELTLKIIDQLGQIIKTVYLDGKSNIEISDLQSGIYFIIGKENKKVVKQKLVVMR